MKNMKTRAKQNRILIAVVGLLLFIVSLIFDKKIVFLVTKIRNPFLDDLMVWVGHYATGLIILIVMTTLFMWSEKKRNWIPVLWISVLVSMLITYLLKIAVARNRPFLTLNFQPLSGATTKSFPSGHAASSFAAVPVLDREFRIFNWFWLSIACLIGFSRIYLGVHYLSDVIFGALLGYFIGELFVYLEENHKIFKRTLLFLKGRHGKKAKMSKKL